MTLPLSPLEPSHNVKVAHDTNLNQIEYISVPEMKGRITSLICGQQRMNLKRLDGASTKQIEGLHYAPSNVPSVREVEVDVDTILIRIPSLTKENYQKLDELHELWSRRERTHTKVIVDLRRNGGGDGESALGLLFLWLENDQARMHFDFPKSIVDSCVSSGLMYGYSQFTSLYLNAPIPPSLRSTLQNSYDSLFSINPCPLRSDRDERYPYNFSMRPKSNPHSPTNKRIIVLVDRNTGSDGEWLAYVLRSIPDSLLVGKNTFGVAQFIRPGYFVLPQTRIAFRLAKGVSDLYGDSRFFDGYGLDADILLEDHSPDVVMKILKSIQ